MHANSRFPLLARSLALLVVASFAACAHPGPQSIAATGGAGTGGGGTTPTVFALSDMDGDWVGKLLPDNLARPERNFYMRVSAGAVDEAADSLGNQWMALDSVRSLEFSVEGIMQSILESSIHTNKMVIDAQMDESMSTLTGTFSHLAIDGALIEGSFTLVRSTGSGHFPATLIEGLWDGFGANERAKRRTFTATLDTVGMVLSGEIRHPGTDELIHSYSSGAGTFTYADDAIGRIDNITLMGDDGSTLTFTYLLIDEEGSLMGGPGFDSQMGAGVAELIRAPVAPK